MFRLNFHRFATAVSRELCPAATHPGSIAINFVFFDDRNDFENFIEFPGTCSEVDPFSSPSSEIKFQPFVSSEIKILATQESWSKETIAPVRPLHYWSPSDMSPSINASDSLLLSPSQFLCIGRISQHTERGEVPSHSLLLPRAQIEEQPD
jgi:hypothetical protein